MAMELALVFPHQLFDPHPAMAPGRRTLLVADPLLFGTDPRWPLAFHARKLVLMRASMRAWAERMREAGHEVRELACPADGATDTAALVGPKLPKRLQTLHVADPVDDLLGRRLRRLADSRGFSLEIHPSPNFLSPPEFLDAQLGGKRKPFMARFYEAQRKRMDLLLDPDGGPAGGKWSFDAENRRRLPNAIEVPDPPHCPPNQHVREAISWVKRRFPDAPGSADGFALPVTHGDAEAWLDEFLAARFERFGDYEDAISREHTVLFHSQLSPMFNIGLLDPQEVVRRAVAAAASGKVALNSLEGFVRQVVGWREFIRAIYELKGTEIRNGNFWNFERPMPRCFYDAGTGIPPVDDAIRRALDHGWCHHIERLMVLGNFMLLCRIRPDDVYRWFMELFVDAWDWVMVPNVYGMSQFADGGTFTTKPYLSGSNYIRKMSDHPKGDWCETWDGLFWTFIADHADFFSGNPRLSMMRRTWEKMTADKQSAHRRNAEGYLANLHSPTP